MLLSIFSTDWHKFPVHLLLLSKFRNPRAIEEFGRGDIWKEVLKESPQKAIKHFLDDGVLGYADIGGHLDYKFKVTELKDMLKQLGFTVSVRKEEMINLLIQADSEGMKKVI
jgi:hypothetical protein